MRIEVLGDESISRQACTYAEYRLFAALPHVVDPTRVRHAHMVLHRAPRGGDGDGDVVTCAVTIEVESGDILRLTTSAGHPYAAINRAIEELRDDPFSRDAAPSADPPSSRDGRESTPRSRRRSSVA